MGVEVDAGCNRVVAGCSFVDAPGALGGRRVALHSMDLDIVLVLGVGVVDLRSLLG